MIIEGIVENLISSAIGAIILFIGGKLLNDYYYIGFNFSNKKDKGKGRQRKIEVYRKLPWRHAYKYAQVTAEKMRDGKAKDLYKPTLIVGIGRGGAIYGSIFSYYMKEAPLLALDRRYYYNSSGERVEDMYYPIEVPEELLSRVLLVAGEYHSGRTMNKFKERLKELGAKEIRTCILYYQTGLKNQVGKPDYYGIKNRRDCLMPWQEKQFLRTWKDREDAERREFTLKDSEMSCLADGFFLMRHASTDANIEDRFIGSGSPNESINTKGKLEARNVGKYLKNTAGKVDIIYCSPMKRCVETALEVSDEAGGEIITDDRLIEVDFGNWEGVRRVDIPKKEYDRYESDANYQIPGSKDTYNSNSARAKSFLDEMIANQTVHGKRVLVITHKTIGRIMVQTIEGTAHLHFRSIPMENASLRRVSVQDDKMSISYYIKVMD